MAILELPYEVEPNQEKHGGDPYNCTLYKMLPSKMQEQTKEFLYLLEYLHMVPVETIGVPEYHEKLSKDLGDKDSFNLIYPVRGGLFIHILDDPEGGRAYYVAVEPKFGPGVDTDDVLRRVEIELLDYAVEFDGTETAEEQRQVLESILDRLFSKYSFDDSGMKGLIKKLIRKTELNPIVSNDADLKVLKYMMARDKIGMGILEPLVLDTNIEDISCSGLGSLFIEHKVFDSLRTAAAFESNAELDEFVLRLSERIKKPVTFRNPIVDATLPDGSRINIVYGEDVSKRGSNFTIRKFAEQPMSIVDLLKFGSLDYTMAAYMSMMIGAGMNVFVSGETASGKTTLLNALNCFIAPDAKIVSIEDTAELQVPHPNWTQEVTRQPKPGEEGSGVGMFDLLKAALRQRPNEILIGEIRGEEGLIAFGAMQTGHAVMATFHASTVEKLIQRVTGSPINVPKTYVENLNVVVIQTAVELPSGKLGRRAVSISEIIGYDSANDAFSFVEVFRWDPVHDKFEFLGEMNSYLLEERIAPAKGIPANKKRQIYAMLRRRARILQKLSETDKTDFIEFYKVIAKAQRQGIF